MRAWAAHIGWGMLILLDVFANVLLSFWDCHYVSELGWRETLSARAARMREKKQPVWWWTASVIDAVFTPFQLNHCTLQLAREREHGGVWRAWRLDAPKALKGGPNDA